MPRLTHNLLSKAKSLDPLLLRLLPTCRDLNSARNELRWLREHVQGLTQDRRRKQPLTVERSLLRELCERRGRGEPLQYILGSEYFGDLEITCRSGVLIPRPETAASVAYLAQLVHKGVSEGSRAKLNNGFKPDPLRVLDLCSGTGCMSLLFLHELLKHHTLPVQPHITGVDISSSAVNLAKLNQERIFPKRDKPAQELPSANAHSTPEHGKPGDFEHRNSMSLDFVKADIFSDRFAEENVKSRASASKDIRCDVIMANPPYISPTEFRRTTARSVRNFEPKLALVPPDSSDPEIQPGDTFYPRILEIAKAMRPQCLLLEVADMDQAIRVVRMVDKMNYNWLGSEIWRDDPSYAELSKLPETDWLVRGRGNGRSVFVHNFASLSVADV